MNRNTKHVVGLLDEVYSETMRIFGDKGQHILDKIDEVQNLIEEGVSGSKLVARKCDVTGEGMNRGYCIDEGHPLFYVSRMYIKYEKDLIKHLRKVERKGNHLYDEDVSEGRITDQWLLNYYYNNEYYYFTEWEDESDYQYKIDDDGNLTEIE